MEEGHSIGEANEEIILEGVPKIMRPSLEMALHFSNGQGGLHGATMRCINLDINTIVDVVRMGLGDETMTPKHLRRYQKAIYESGLRDIGTKCVSILGSLANGGRKVADKAEEDDAEDGDESPLAETASA
jgi:hypothetical protein